MDGRPSFLREGGQNPAYRSTHHPLFLSLLTTRKSEPCCTCPIANCRSRIRARLTRLRTSLFSLARAPPALAPDPERTFGIGWMVSQALVWAAVGAAIDHGVERHSDTELFKWVGVVIGLGLFQAVCGALRHQLAVTNWMSATYRTIQLIGRHIAKTGTRSHRRDTCRRHREHGGGRRDAYRWFLRHLRPILGRHRRLARRLVHPALNLCSARTRRTPWRAHPWLVDDPTHATASRHPSGSTRSGRTTCLARCGHGRGASNPARRRR